MYRRAVSTALPHNWCLAGIEIEIGIESEGMWDSISIWISMPMKPDHNKRMHRTHILRAGDP